jgi:hypothetical protein
MPEFTGLAADGTLAAAAEDGAGSDWTEPSLGVRPKLVLHPKVITRAPTANGTRGGLIVLLPLKLKGL